MRLSFPIELEGSVQTRIHFDKKKNHWVIQINDKIGLVQEFYCNTEPYMMVFMRDNFGDTPVMKTYPSDEVSKFKKSFYKER